MIYVLNFLFFITFYITLKNVLLYIYIFNELEILRLNIDIEHDNEHFLRYF